MEDRKPNGKGTQSIKGKTMLKGMDNGKGMPQLVRKG